MMATPKVLDSYALIAFFENETGAETVEQLLLNADAGDTQLLMTVINLGEIWYGIARADSPAAADEKIKSIRDMPIEIVDVDWTLARAAAEFKARGGLSYADCFVAALARLRSAELVTGDPEFKRLASEVPIIWLR